MTLFVPFQSLFQPFLTLFGPILYHFHLSNHILYIVLQGNFRIVFIVQNDTYHLTTSIGVCFGALFYPFCNKCAHPLNQSTLTESPPAVVQVLASIVFMCCKNVKYPVISSKLDMSWLSQSLWTYWACNQLSLCTYFP